MIAYLGSDNVLRLTGASTVDLETGLRVFLDAAAVVTFRIQTTDYEDVTGETWPVPMQYIPGSTGDFLGVVRDTILFEVDRAYRLIADVTVGLDQHRRWDMPLTVLVSQE
jgi:hypothetical protein